MKANHHLSTLVLAALTLITLSLQGYAEKKHIVFLVGDDLNHASGTHEFFAGAKLLEKSLAGSQFSDQFTCTVVNNWPEDTSVFEKADVLVHYYKGNKTHFMNEHHDLIDKLSDKGLGQLFVHYAVDPGPAAEPFIKKWTGAVYKDKYSSNPHWDLKAILENHPINTGVDLLELRDEWYVKMDYECDCAIDHEGKIEQEKVHAIMRGTPQAARGNKKLTKALKNDKKPSDMVVFWAKERSNGARGAGVTGAHFHKNWANDAFRKQILNAIVWCTNLPVPEGGVTSPTITEDILNENLDKRKPKFGRLKLTPKLDQAKKKK